MPDHEESPPPVAFGTGLLKPVNPEELTLGGPVSGAPISASPAPEAPTMGTAQATVSQFTFQYVYSGKTYKAVITHSYLTGYDINLEKWAGSGWIPSTSTLKRSLLSAFIVQQATAQAMKGQASEKPAKAASGAAASEPQYTPDAEVTIAADGQTKQPVKG
jgi:hypothetical protein